MSFPVTIEQGIIRTRYPVGESGSFNNIGPEAGANSIENGVSNITPIGTVHLSGGTAPVYNRDGELNSSYLSLPGARPYGVVSSITEAQQGSREEGFFGTHGTSSLIYPEFTGVSDPFVIKPMYAYYYPQASQTFMHMPRSARKSTATHLVVSASGHPGIVTGKRQ